MKKLTPGEYFNDNLIDLRVKHLVFKLLPGKQSRVHAFNCQFYTKLQEKRNVKDNCHGLVARWTKKFNLFDKDFIFIPVNKSMHWSLAVIAYPGHIMVRNFSPTMSIHRCELSANCCIPFSARRPLSASTQRPVIRKRRQTRPAYCTWTRSRCIPAAKSAMG
jgi:Ulp1 family protease